MRLPRSFSPASDDGKPRLDRRAWLGMVGLATAGVGVAAVRDASPADAATGDPVEAGGQTDAEESTVVFADGSTYPFGLLTATDTAFTSFPTSFPFGAITGFAGKASSGTAGVSGQGTTYGMYGSGTTYGVYGVGQTGVYGKGPTGVEGSGITTGVSGSGLTGVSGDGVETGVEGSGTSIGVSGSATADGGSGVCASSSGVDSFGLVATTDTGTGISVGVTSAAATKPAILATTAGSGPAIEAVAGTGPALAVTGVAEFSRSGLAKINKGSSGVTVSGVVLSATSLILATPQTNVAGVGVQGVVKNVNDSHFTIHLTEPVTAQYTVAWFIVG